MVDCRSLVTPRTTRRARSPRSRPRSVFALLFVCLGRSRFDSRRAHRLFVFGTRAVCRSWCWTIPTASWPATRPSWTATPGKRFAFATFLRAPHAPRSCFLPSHCTGAHSCVSVLVSVQPHCLPLQQAADRDGQGYLPSIPLDLLLSLTYAGCGVVCVRVRSARARSWRTTPSSSSPARPPW